MFIDKSHLDTKGKLTCEPIMICLGWNKREYRIKPEAQRCIGYMPSLKHVVPAKAKAEDKLRDYHHCLDIIQSELVEY
jgi:hypothetical protein